MAGGQMPVFGLEPLGYSESMSFLPSVPQVGTSGYAEQHHTLANAATAVEPGDYDYVDTGMPDFALMDDALMRWSDLPPAAGWEEWGAYFADTNNAGT